DVDVGRVHEQEHHQDRQHVDERHQRHVVAALDLLAALAVALDAIRRHVGASPPETSGNSSATSHFEPGTGNTRTVSITLTSVSYAMSCSSRMVASVFSLYFDFTSARYSCRPLRS